MPLFHYRAKRFDGKTIAGVIELDDEMVLIDRLHRKRAVLLSVKQIEGDQKVNVQAGYLERFKERLKATFNTVTYGDMLLFTHQLAAMFGAGVPLSRCLESLGKDIKNKKLQEVVLDINRDIESGDDLSDALAKHPYIFNKLYINMVHAGESSGTLGIILNQLSFYLETTLNVRGKLKGALAYPVALLSFALLVVMVMLLFIIPQFSHLYSRIKVPLPLPTKIMMLISDSLKESYILYLLVFLGLWLIFWLILQTEQGRYTWDRLKLHIPIIGSLITKGIFTQFSRTLSILLKSGLPIIQSIRIVSESISNTYIEKKINECALKIQKGATISEAFSESRIFPALTLQMISSGEESGTLFTMLSKIADFYQQQINTSVSTLTSLIEPVLIVIIGIIIGLLAVSIFLPIFKMGGVIR